MWLTDWWDFLFLRKKIRTSQSNLVLNRSIVGISSSKGIDSLSVGPLSAFTPETIQIMDVAAAQIADARELRRRARVTILDCMENAKIAGKTVDDYFVKKISESVSLTVKINFLLFVFLFALLQFVILIFKNLAKLKCSSGWK